VILYNIPYKRLLARVNGYGNRFQNRRYNKILSIEQEISLIRIINRMKFNGIYYRQFMIFSIANFLFRKIYDDLEIESSTINKFWITRSLTRNPELNTRLLKFLSFDRRFAHDIEGILKKLYNFYVLNMKLSLEFIKFNLISYRISFFLSPKSNTLYPKKLRILRYREYIYS
jgi:hypothetical protein